MVRGSRWHAQFLGYKTDPVVLVGLEVVGKFAKLDSFYGGDGLLTHSRASFLTFTVFITFHAVQILLLKYLHHKRGSKFQAVHSASSSPGCPLPLLMLAIRAFPNQIREADEHSGNGNLPLHMVASWGIKPSRREEQEDSRAPARYAASMDPIAQRTKTMVVSELLTEYPDAARVRNKRGKTPLALLVEAGGTWFNGGVRRMVRAYPEALNIRDRKTGLMPFMAAAAACRGSNARDGSYADLKVLTTIFELLRNEPRAVRPSSRSRKKKKRSEANRQR